MQLIEAFWAESSPQQRRLLLDEAAGRAAGAVTFEFDIFDVTLDFDRGTAIVADVIGNDEPEAAPLDAFLERAAAFADDPSIGDALTEMQRRPPRFAAGPDGTVRPLGEGDR